MQTPSLMRYLMALKHLLAFLIISEKDLRLQTEVLIWKRQKTYQRTKCHRINEEKRRLYWNTLATERYSRRSQSWFEIPAATIRRDQEGKAWALAILSRLWGPPGVDRDHCTPSLSNATFSWEMNTVTEMTEYFMCTFGEHGTYWLCNKGWLFILSLRDICLKA